MLSYSAATLLGMAPGLLATSVFGTQISVALEDLSQVNYGIPAAAAVVLGVVAWLAARWLKRNLS